MRKGILATQEMEQQPVAGVEAELIIDETHDNYWLAQVGWSPQGRVHGATLYVRIRNGKFWIEQDWTEETSVQPFTQSQLVSRVLRHPDQARTAE